MPASASQIEPPGAIDVLGLPIRPLRVDGLVELLVQRAKAGVRTRACYANAHTTNLACKDAAFRALLAQSEVLYADGASLVWASRWSAARLPERMTAADYYRRFARRCAAEGLSIYLLGGKKGVAQTAAETLCREIPDLRIAGTEHGYFDAAQSAEIVDRVNRAAADILLVGLGSPRQEQWLGEVRDSLETPVCWCVGALLDYIAGVERRAPAWMCRLGGEWLFRLLVDPLGKWRRYVLGNPMFVLNTMRWGMRRTNATGAKKHPHPTEV